ncbi:MAG: hypothetical protein ACYSX0_11995 [Planctomycetota bacterium]|jgi:hypothetical protein
MQGVVLLLLAVALPAGLALGGVVEWAWVGLGAAAWAAALFIKAIPGGLLWLATERWIGDPGRRAAIWGFWSAFCELGATSVVFLSTDTYPDLFGALGFGIGAAAVEILYVIGAAILDAKDGESAAEEDHFVAWSGVMERASTFLGHVAARGLVWVGLQDSRLMPAFFLGVVTFSLVDGIAVYGTDAGWNWSEPRLGRRFQLFLAAVTAFEFLVFFTSVQALRSLG